MPITNPDPVDIDESPAQLLAEGSGVGWPLVVYNEGADTVYLGGAFVDDTNGIPLVAGGLFTYEVPHQDDLYAICGTGDTATVRLMFGLH